MNIRTEDPTAPRMISPEEIVKSIRASNEHGDLVLSDSEAALMITLYASLKIELSKVTV